MRMRPVGEDYRSVTVDGDDAFFDESHGGV
jgi:hypothetical protein